MKTAALLSLLPAVLALPPLTPAQIAKLLDGLGPAPASDPRFTHFVPAGPGDVRSPCPGLNTLANHGFLPHSGKGITIPDLVSGLAQGLNVGPDFSVSIGGLGLLASPEPYNGSFDLDQLDQHNFPIEHDASMSRADAYTGNDHSFNRTLWNQVLTYYKGHKQTSYVTSANARYARTENSSVENPTFTYGAEQFLLAYGESGLYTQTMSSPLSNGVADVAYINSLFIEQKLPVALGWRPSVVPVTLETLGLFIVQLFTAIPPSKFLPEGVNITANSYKDLFTNAVGGSEVLANLTQNISKHVGL